ncbi:MAG: entericidin A/B family lipoprotein [Thiohalocapsa sp.]|jgi:predicted small secreted protein|nr:entericidin A/B family lipoprotein [Thiohalocapsa sp.]MCF7991505.1 entericidin A/B family lipoprotein [Thiohalocapsa sp.]
MLQPAWFRSLIPGLLAALALTLSGCNTVEGVGEDLEAAGQGLEDSAEDNKRY